MEQPIQQLNPDIEALVNILQTDNSLKEFREAFPNPPIDLVEFASRAEFITYDLAGYQIIKQGEDANHFFIVMSGQLRAIDMSTPEKPHLLNYMTRGSFVGTRGLLSGDKRAATVEVVTRAKVAMFEEDDWNWLVNRSPRMRTLFETLENNRIRQSNIDFPGRQDDEVVVISTKRHPVAFVATLPLPLTLLIAPIIFFLMAELLQIEFLDVITDVFVLVATLPFIIVALLLMAYNYFDWRNDDLIVTTKRVIHIERILFYAEQRRDAPLARVQDVTTESDIFDLLFDSDNLKITTAGVGSIRINHIRRADEVRQTILEQAEQAKARVSEADVHSLQRRIASQLNWNNRLPQNVLAVAEEEWSDKIDRTQTRHYARVIDYFIPRVQEVDQVGGSTVVTWRKHRYVLFVNVIAPTLILIGAVYLSLTVGTLFPLLQILIGIAILGSFIWYVWAYDDWHKDLYQVTDTQIIDIESAAFRLRRHRRDGSFDNIQNVYTEIPNLFYRLLNMGNVVIETAGSEDTFTFKKVHNPASVNKEIFNRWSLYQQRQREKTRDATTKQVMDVLKEYHRLSEKVKE
jgi:uncharacterized membrane protein YdbT with pleckstrin-like domain